MTVENNNDYPSGQAAERSPAPQAPVSLLSSELHLVDLLIVLARRKWLLVGFPMLVAILAVGISLLIPNVFSASTKLLPPQQAQSGASAMLAQLGGAVGLAAGLGGGKSQGEIYVGILKSRTVADRLIERFALKNKYDTPSQDIARAILAGNTNVVSGKDGMIAITVDDKDQKFVASLANGYVEELQRLNRTLAITEASQRRMFFEKQLETAKDNLAKVEMSLKGAIDRHGVVSVDSESRAILETAARLRAQVSAKEIQLGSMRAFVTAQNPEYLRVSEELGSLRSELAKLEGGRSDQADPSKNNPSGLENVQLMRDLKYYQMLYELLAKQFEVARLDEAKEPSLIQVLDIAIEPERKAKPRRALIVIGAALVSFFAALVWILFSAARQHAMKFPAEAARWNELQSHLRFKKAG
jgi:tyrosine-protein kinase Etk/Wzc